MTYAIYHGATEHTDRALMLSHTVHRFGQEPVPVAVIMFDVKRATDRHYRQVGERALQTLRALGVDTGTTDALAFGSRYAHPATNVTVAYTHAIDQDTGDGPVRVAYTHDHGGGDLPGTTDVLRNTGDAFVLPAIDYSRTVN